MPSLIDYAFEIMQNKQERLSFKDLWAQVVEAAQLSEEVANAKVARFYTNLSLDGRFVVLDDNKWDLRERHTLEEVHRDLGDIYSDDAETDIDAEEQEEIEEYEEVLSEKQPIEEEDGEGIEPDIGEREEDEE